ncbi:MAG: hypothetical protein WA919_25985 [Coleofasciculaceae cyanobacterium]
MTVTVNKTLLALVLAIKDLENLSENEQNAFRDAAARQYFDSANWSKYEADLLRVIEANPHLNQQYQTTKSQLDALNSKIPSTLLPTQAQLQQAIPSLQTPETRGFAPVMEDDESQEINNMVINVLTTPNPPETAQKLSSLEKLKQFLQGNREQETENR